jgi:hypothetical protein
MHVRETAGSDRNSSHLFANIFFRHPDALLIEFFFAISFTRKEIAREHCGLIVHFFSRVIEALANTYHMHARLPLRASSAMKQAAVSDDVFAWKPIMRRVAVPSIVKLSRDRK